MKEFARRSTKIMAPIVAGGATIAMIFDIGSQIWSGATGNLAINLAGWLAFIVFVIFVWHATVLHLEHRD